jgi:hypothetical protein
VQLEQSVAPVELRNVPPAQLVQLVEPVVAA